MGSSCVGERGQRQARASAWRCGQRAWPDRGCWPIDGEVQTRGLLGFALLPRTEAHEGTGQRGAAAGAWARRRQHRFELDAGGGEELPRDVALCRHNRGGRIDPRPVLQRNRRAVRGDALHGRVVPHIAELNDCLRLARGHQLGCHVLGDRPDALRDRHLGQSSRESARTGSAPGGRRVRRGRVEGARCAGDSSRQRRACGRQSRARARWCAACCRRRCLRERAGRSGRPWRRRSPCRRRRLTPGAPRSGCRGGGTARPARRSPPAHTARARCA